ncbi:peptidase M23 [Biomaibacter acetigenes]|uniref:Peptidase M23 n=1 Tax=Biomaibacter acetigenes TaxID=2316383 RepID=A0A3G2R6Y0_9FIRM|nr:peptidoglycan DD-metalloendopeptidase family protein [Biomaibacter acetigenes]AYO31176.1 peptidase M23 [Biomaibacter acetigenes]
MVKKKYRLLSILLTVIFICANTVSAFAIDLQDLKKQQQAIQSKITSIRNRLKDVNNKRRDVASELAVIENDLKKAQNELAATEAKLRDTQQKLVNTQQELEAAQAQVENQQETLNIRIKAMYMTGPVDYIEVLLASSSFSDFLTRLDMVKRIIDSDKNLLADFREKKEIVEQKKAELEEQHRQIAEHKKNISRQKATIASRQADRKKLYDELEEQRKEYERQEDKLQEDAARLARMIQELQAKSKRAYMGTGVFRWPVPSSTNVTSDYGWRVHPIFKSRRFHEGIDIAAPTDSTVVAADDGVVIYTGWYGGYGNTIIIDHGDKISSRYSHLSKILVNDGEKVKKGDKIGLVGSTGWSTGPHLDFGVIKDGQHVNPWNWLK